MRKLAVTLSTIVIIFTAPVLVAAAELFTPLIFVQGGESIACTALNVTSKAQTVTVQLRNASGGAVGGGGTPNTLDPGEGESDFLYCQFTVVGAQNAIRAGAMVKPGGTFIPAQ